MKKVKLVLLSIAVLTSAANGGVCREKHHELRASRKALRECNKAWTDSLRGDAIDPADDCAATQARFVTAVKALKTCVKEAKSGGN